MSKNEIQALKVQNARLKEEVAFGRTRMARLEAAVHALLSSERVRVQDLEFKEIKTVDREGETSDDDDEEELPDAYWHESDDVYRCTECFWEVVEGICQQCAKEFAYDSDEGDPSISTNNEAMSLDRALEIRGTTPLIDVDPSAAPSFGLGYELSKEESQSLLARGATSEMCKRFHLSYSDEKGIIAWADTDLYEAFSGPAMQPGDFWKIYLGRRVQLSPKDRDGSEFVEGLIEDSVLYRNYAARAHSDNSDPENDLDNRVEIMMWKTTEESPGIWATKPFVWNEEIADEAPFTNYNGSFRWMLPRSGQVAPLDSEEEDATFLSHKAYDQALEGPPQDIERPVLDPEYESASDDESTLDQADFTMGENEIATEELEALADPGWTYDPNIPDGVWEDAETGDEEMEDVDSDFDDDEDLWED